jgi:hypothetical protein
VWQWQLTWPRHATCDMRMPDARRPPPTAARCVSSVQMSPAPRAQSLEPETREQGVQSNYTRTSHMRHAEPHPVPGPLLALPACCTLPLPSPLYMRFVRSWSNARRQMSDDRWRSWQQQLISDLSQLSQFQFQSTAVSKQAACCVLLVRIHTRAQPSHINHSHSAPRWALERGD